MFPAGLQAANVAVAGDNTGQSITVTIEDAPLNSVLENLRKRYGFEIVGLENTSKGEALSATMTGSLRSVIERLLRNWNYMIVRSAEIAGGIEKVMILNMSYGAAPHQGATGSASSEDEDSGA